MCNERGIKNNLNEVSVGERPGEDGEGRTGWDPGEGGAGAREGM